MIAHHAGEDDPEAFVIVSRHILAAQDIAQTIRDEIPDAQVLIFADEAEAIAELQGFASVALAFVAADPGPFAASDLRALLEIRGSRIVLMGDEAETHGATAEWEVLPWPFSTAAVIALLRQAEAHRTVETACPASPKDC